MTSYSMFGDRHKVSLMFSRGWNDNMRHVDDIIRLPNGEMFGHVV